MVSFTKLLSFVFLAVSVDSLPFTGFTKHSTHRKRIIGRGIEVETYHPTVSYQTFGAGKIVPSSFVPQTLEETTRSFVASELGIDFGDVSFNSASVEENISYAYVKQSHDGVDFVNAVANVAYKDNKVVAFGSSFVDASNIAPSTPTTEVDDIVASIEEQLDGKFNGYKSVNYLTQPDGSVALTHAIQIQNEETHAWYEALVDAHSGELLSVIDFVNELTYRVVPITKQAVTEGTELLVDPEDIIASPGGWVAANDTAGNNVVAYKSSQSSTSPTSSTGVFDYPWTAADAPATANNLDAARVNAFYLMNSLHDIYYRYGFTETAFNFQASNFGLGGSQNDRVLMSVQDGAGFNDARFSSPPDGQSGLCRMFIWTLTNPNRDGSLENDIPVHEMTHGLTTRLTGGGTSRCLQTTEAGGMGEGWSDALAFWTEQTSATIRDFTLGGYVTNSIGGIRSFPYSTSATTNPLRYSTIKTLNEVHDIGEVWANILFNVYAALVGEHGFDASAPTNPDSSAGNAVWLHLLIDALKLQPCNPTLVAARDAWIQADVNRYSGANRCLLWNAFASRGLGMNAASFSDSPDVPSDC